MIQSDFQTWFADQVQGGDEWTGLERIAARDAWDHQQARVAALEAELGAAREKLRSAQADAGERRPWWQPVRTGAYITTGKAEPI